MNNKQSHINDDLLVKHLLGEATAAEQAEVTAWIAESETNRKYYEQFRLIWDNSKKTAATSTINEDEAWKRFRQRVAAEQPAPKIIPLSPGRKWMGYAASLVALLGSFWMMYYAFYNATSTIVAEATVITETLPDGTVVTLNAGSSIKFNRRFTGDTRDVALSGEAFFDVTPDKHKPFIISTENAKIKVVGTSFNVNSSAEKTEVIVETGIVEVSRKNMSVQLNPKERTVVLQNSERLIKEKVDDVLYNYYRTKELVCNNTPLSRLVNVLNDAYDVQITIADEKVKDMPITTTFKNESIDDILNTISQTLNVKVEKNGKFITIK